MADSILSEDDLVNLAVTAIELDGRRCAIAAASNLLAAIHVKSPKALTNYATGQSAVAIIRRAVDRELAEHSCASSKHTVLCRATDGALAVASNAFITASSAAQTATASMQDAQKRATGAAHQHKLTLARMARARQIGRAWRKAIQRRMQQRIVDKALEIARTGSASAAESLRLAMVAYTAITATVEKTGIFRQSADSSLALNQDLEQYTERIQIEVDGPTRAEFDDDDRAGNSAGKEKVPPRRTDGKVHPEHEMTKSDDEQTSIEKKGGCDIQ